MEPTRLGTVRPRVQIPGPRPKIDSNRGFACYVWRAGVTGRSQIFLELGGGSPVQVDFGPTIELAHGSRTADISARARPQDREAPGFENQRRCPRRCAASAQVRTVRHPTQNSKLESALAGEFLNELENVSHRAGAIEIWLVEAVMSGAGYWASSQSRQR